MSFFPDSFNARHFPFENNTMKSWSHIWLMLNKLTLKPSTYNAFAMSDNLGREIVPFYLRLAPITESDISIFLRLENHEERTVSSHVSWAPIIKVPQTCVHYLKCRLHHKAHFMLAWQIHRNGFFFHLPFMYKIFDFHPSQMNSLAHSHFEAVYFLSCHTKTFFNNQQDSFQITFRLAFLKHSIK